MHSRARAAFALTLAWVGLSACGQIAPNPEPAAPSPQVATSSVAATPASVKPAKESAPPPQSSLTASLLYELLVGEIAFDTGNQQQGAAYMLNAARRTGDEALYRRATEMAIQSRAGPAALEAVHAWRSAKPESPDAIRYELQVLLALGRIADTAVSVQALLRILPEQEKLMLVTALPALYQRVTDRSLVARTVEDALAPALQDPKLAAAAWTSIGRVRLQGGDRAGALAAATLGMNADAASPWPARLAVQLLPDEASAEPIIRRYLASPDSDPEDRLDFIRALAAAGRDADAQEQIDILIGREPGNVQAWWLRGQLQAQVRQDDKAESSLLHYLDLLNRQEQLGDSARAMRDRAYMTLAGIAERRHDARRAEDWLKRVDSPEQVLDAQLQRAGVLARAGHLDEARKLIQSAPERDPKDARRKLQAEAQLLREQGDATQAWQLLEAAIQRYPDDDGLMYDAAMAAERLGRIDEMERLLRRVIELKPDSAAAYNALGYSLADRGLRLSEAKTLIEKAAKLAPADGYIQDSLGWVEFRLGNLGEARRILQAAWQKRPDPEIAAHLGEVLWTLGERDAARQAWGAGLRLDAKNETLLRTLERFQVQP